MSFHIVTDRCFLICEKVIAIVIEDALPEEELETKSKAKKSKKQEPLYSTISITYKLTNSNSNYDGESLLEIRISEKAKALSIYNEIIKQVQEQFPDDIFLDKLVHNLLGDASCEIVEPKKK